MTLRDFIKENKEEIDKAIRRACSNCRLNDKERELWIRNDESLYNQQREYGLERSKMFSWKKTAENLLKVYNSVLKQA